MRVNRQGEEVRSIVTVVPKQTTSVQKHPAAGPAVPILLGDHGAYGLLPIELLQKSWPLQAS